MSEKIEQLVAMRLSSYFKNQPDTPALAELKTELATDLNEAANDKHASGLDAEAAVAEAFSDFGDINALIAQVQQENGNDQHLHEHRVSMDDDSFKVDDGETLKIDRSGVYLKGGDAFTANADGVSINHGAIKADANGFKLGNVVFNEDGININGKPVSMPDFEPTFPTLNLAGEYHDSLNLVNEQHFDVAALQHVTVAYRSARVKIMPTRGANDEIIVREYMNHNNTTYHAQITQQGDTLAIDQGKFPFLIPLRVHVQILIPSVYAGNLTVENRSGALLVAGLTKLQVVNLRIVSGDCRVANVQAQAMSADITSGNFAYNDGRVTDQLGMLVKSGRIRLSRVQAGQFTVSATSGTIQGNALRGGGSWTAKTGALKLGFAAIDGNINLNAKSGTIKVAVPEDASYQYELEAHSGHVSAPKNGVSGHTADGYQTGQVGQTAPYKIIGRTTSGSIRLY
ncbi:DUF4097 family beta strand repeat-containing protein [Lactiplantibacillus fabifermentans]|uniref:DUF4097 domain-containing protein n=2 Tax=Lactiplantibacillus fabifermentans TaxID=483011 RepID=A0A0R2NRZ6_9LACO|nr:DUF4097 family beta strand repeat-containing protein [Lactiplantibacillus fabifermentans]ETY74882.1 hypothetical protein LFAB_05050 [Lactiplantibacillus fabifermentans T30PCM01]KRO28430.1 hypothetical protein DY78_GL002425 [Lactiplantibacillus fabifermentans DSM 21115]